MQFAVDYCDQGMLDSKYPGQKNKCKSIAASNLILPQIQIQLALLTGYFDQTAFGSDQIKNLINMDIFMSMQQNMSNTYYYRISEN